MMGDDLCIHDLPKVTCSLCLAKIGTNLRRAGYARAGVRSGPPAPPSSGPRVRRGVTPLAKRAEFESVCPGCEELILEGDLIRRDEDEWVHLKC